MPTTFQDDVLQRLNATLERAPLPDRLRLSGQALAERLASPVRLSFMGRPGVGKTTLIRALFGPGAQALNGGAPTYELAYGDAPWARVTLEDGTHCDVDGADVEDILALAPVFIELHRPCPDLRSVSVLELVTDGSPAELSVAAPWAAKRSNIPIWCTKAFDRREAQIWSKVPAAYKDHAILVLTQADAVPTQELVARLDQAYETEGTGFCIIAPVAAEHALNMQVSDSTDAEALLAASGIGALRAEIFRRVHQGRQLDLDHAEIFLSRFEKPKARKLSKPRPPSQPNELQKGDGSKVLKSGAELMQQQAQEMLIDIEEFGPFATGKIVERCLETANKLVDLIADDTPVDAPSQLAHSAASDAADMLLLMTLENTADAAEDAVHLMLQVKRELDLAA
ncbi:MAG: hypothetical protein AAFN44_08340 [Pseudomonadota bacterium]